MRAGIGTGMTRARVAAGKCTLKSVPGCDGVLSLCASQVPAAGLMRTEGGGMAQHRGCPWCSHMGALSLMVGSSWFCWTSQQGHAGQERSFFFLLYFFPPLQNIIYFCYVLGWAEMLFEVKPCGRVITGPWKSSTHSEAAGYVLVRLWTPPCCANTCLHYSPNDSISHAAAVIMMNRFTYSFGMMTSKFRAWLHGASLAVGVWQRAVLLVGASSRAGWLALPCARPPHTAELWLVFK